MSLIVQFLLNFTHKFLLLLHAKFLAFPWIYLIKNIHVSVNEWIKFQVLQYFYCRYPLNILLEFNLCLPFSLLTILLLINNYFSSAIISFAFFCVIFFAITHRKSSFSVSAWRQRFRTNFYYFTIINLLSRYAVSILLVRLRRSRPICIVFSVMK